MTTLPALGRHPNEAKKQSNVIAPGGFAIREEGPEEAAPTLGELTPEAGGR